MGRQLLTVDEVRGCWAIMPTPATPDAGDWRVQDTVDLDETARTAEKLIAAASNPGLGIPDNFMAEAAPPG